MSIYKKLLEIQKKINGFKKDKKSFSYEYVSGTKVLEYIKPLMNEYGLILKQEITSIDNTRQDYLNAKGAQKNEILSKVMMRFTWIDCETGESDVNEFGANGQNDWEKGLGSALTYAERYFLLKFFHIATDEDDIDNAERKTSAGVPIETAIREAKTLAELTAIYNKYKPTETSLLDLLREKKLSLNK
jgi:ERF superfamily